MSRNMGATRGTWWIAMTVIVLLVAAAFVVIVLVRQDVLDRWWAYAVLPIAIIAAAAARVLTIFKAGREGQGGTEAERGT